jgi:cytochrome c5
MMRLSLFKTRIWAGLALAVLAATLLAMSSGQVTAADAKADKDTKPDTKPDTKVDAKTEKKPEKKKLTGAELYNVHCNRCHAERYATEFTPAQWKTIMMHMRVRANLPAAQARTIQRYLIEDSGTP